MHDTWTRTRVLLMTVLAFGVLAPGVFAQIPCDSDAPLHAAHVAAMDEHFRVTLIEAEGKAPDAQRRRWFEALRDHMLERSSPALDAQRIVSVGANSPGKAVADPLTEFGVAFGSALQFDWPNARKRLEPVIAKLMEGSTAINIKAVAAETMARTLERWPDQQDTSREWFDRARELRIESLTTDFYRSAGVRVAYGEITRVAFARLPVSQRQKLYEAMKSATGIDPWLIDVVGGRFHIGAAWEARGSGWADSVTPRGWQGFAEHLTQAEACLVRAHALHPERPEAATDLITIAMGQGMAAGKDARYWFDQAVKADFDWSLPYNKLILSMRPRWGGSLDEMHAFGVECLATKRFDTNVPSMYGWALCKIAEDLGWDWSFLQERDLYPTLKVLYERSAAEAKTKESRLRHLTRQLAFARHAEQWDDAYAFLTARELFEFDRTVLSECGIHNNQDLFADITAHARLPRGSLADAEQAVREGRHADAVTMFKTLQSESLANQGEQPPVRDKMYLERFFKRELQSNQWRADIAAGGWVDITPRDKELFGWRAVRGSWSANHRGGVTGQSSPLSMILLCDTYFGDRFEIEVVIPFPLLRAGLQYNGGIVMHFDDERNESYDMLLYDPHTGDASVRYGWIGMELVNHRTAPTPENGSVTLSVQFWDGLIVARVNDNAIYAGAPVHSPNSPRFKIGIGASHGIAGRSVSFNSVRIKMLPTAPIELEQALLDRGDRPR